MKMMKVAVLVSGGGTNLQALLDAQHAGKLGCARLALVISDREGVPALERAARAQVPARCFDRKGLGWPQAERLMLAALQAEGISLIVLAGFLSILSPAFIQAYRNRILNVHPSLIPAFSGEGFYGIKVHQAALVRGVKITGATVHLVNEQADGGPILMQKAVRVKETDTPQTLQRRVMAQAEWVLLPRAVKAQCRKLLKQEEER